MCFSYCKFYNTKNSSRWAKKNILILKFSSQQLCAECIFNRIMKCKKINCWDFPRLVNFWRTRKASSCFVSYTEEEMYSFADLGLILKYFFFHASIKIYRRKCCKKWKPHQRCSVKNNIQNSRQILNDRFSVREKYDKKTYLSYNKFHNIGAGM
jgi:hypothetical protein